jgi:histone H2A
MKQQQEFSLYTKKVLSQLHSDMRLSEDAKCQMTQFINTIGQKIMHAADLMITNKTIDSRIIMSAVKIVFPDELARHAMSEGSKAVQKFTTGGAGTKSHRESVAIRSGLTFPPSRARHIIEQSKHSRISATAPVYLAGVLEYITADLLELSGNAARDNNKKTVTPVFMLLAIRHDEELSQLMTNISMTMSRH